MFAFFQGVSVITTSLIGAVLTAAAIQPLTVGEKHRLAAYVAYLVAVDVDGGGGETVYHAGDYCPSCNPGGKPLYPQKGAGWVGDGTVFEKCAFETDDGKLACMGTGILREVGDVAEAEYNLDELGMTPEEVVEQLAEEQEEPDIVCLGGNTWTFEDKRVAQASDADMRRHLINVHDVEADSVNKMSRNEMIALHNLLHNTEVRASAPSSSAGSSSCPSGNCPTSSSGSFTRRRGLFRR